MAKQKNPGKVFEDEIKASCAQEGLFIHRVNDTSQSYTYSAIFTPKTRVISLFLKCLFYWR